MAEYNAGYYDANRDKYAEWNRLWYSDNRDRKAAQGSAWRANNPEKTAEMQKRWRRGKSELLKGYSERRRALELSAPTVDFTQEQWRQRVAYYGGKCWICQERDYEHMDHVKPLTRGGSHMLANLRPACGPCNRQKRATWPFDVNEFRKRKNLA